MQSATNEQTRHASGIGIIPDYHHFPRFEGQPYGQKANRLIQTAEDLLARREPEPGPYWPSNPRNDDNDTLPALWEYLYIFSWVLAGSSDPVRCRPGSGDDTKVYCDPGGCPPGSGDLTKVS